MDDLISKLQNVLSDEESMKQIRELAGMLSGEGQQSSSPPPGSEASSPTSGGQGESMPDIASLLSKLGMTSGGGNTEKNSVPTVSPAPSSHGHDQPSGSAPDISALLAGLTSTGSKSQADSGGGFDISKLLKLQTIMAQSNKSDKNVELLLALKPLLKEENQAKIDRLIKIFKFFAVYPALKESGLLGGDLFGLL